MSIDEIARIGGWNNEVVSQIYLAGYSAKMILAMGNWPEAGSGDLKQYWAERLLMPMPPELMQVIYPFTPNLEAQILEAKNKNMSIKSAESVYDSLHWFATVIFQDALDLIPATTARGGPLNPCHQKLMNTPIFVEKLNEYQALKQSGVSANYFSS